MLDMTQLLVFVAIMIAITIGVTMYLDQAENFATKEASVLSATSTEAEGGLKNIIDSAHTAAEQLQPLQ